VFLFLFANLGAACLMMLLAWGYSLKIRSVSFVDILWGLGFVLVVWLSLTLAPAVTSRSVLLVILVTVWGFRLALHIGVRNHGKPEDRRYQEMRLKHGDRFPLVSLFTVFLTQALLLWVVSLAVQLGVFAPEPKLPAGPLDWIGIMAWCIGFGFEALADLQMLHFKRDPANKGKVLDSGLWALSRHPNYFGESVMWWAIYVLVLPTGYGLPALISPLLITFLLLKVSGVTLAEKGMSSRRPDYEAYRQRTSTFFPWFPKKSSRAE
jgi:steroid 5-alpha reductase family enzyme